MSQMSRTAINSVIAIAAVLVTTSAVASQGPGVMAGTASAFTQTATAIVVYGLSALIIATGLIGSLRQH